MEILPPQPRLEPERPVPVAAESWILWLSHASRQLSATLDYETTLGVVAELVVPAFADCCFVDLLQPDGSVRRTAVAHADPARADLAQRVRGDFVPRPEAAAGVARVVRTGEPEAGEVGEEVLAGIASGPEQLATVRALGARAYMCVPLTARGRTLGALLFMAAESGRSYAEADLLRAVDLADRAALAIDNARLHEAEQQARRRAERLQELTAALAAAVTQREVGDVVMRQGVEAMQAYAGVIALRTADGAALEILSSVGYSAACMGPGARWPVGADIPVAEATRAGAPVFIESREAWAARYPGGRAPQGSPSASWAAVPLTLAPGESPRGALLWTFDRPHLFGDDDRALLLALARLCAQALERARLHEAENRARESAERAVARLTRLQALTTRLSEALTPAEVAEVVVEQGIAALGARAGSVALLDADGQELHLLRAVGYPEAVVERFRRIPLAASFPLSDAVREGAPLLLLTAAEREARYPHLAGLRRHNGEGAMAAVPLVVQGRIIGAIGLNFPAGVTLAAEDRTFLFALTEQCGQALERARLYEAERQARAEAEAANRAKSQFLASMSHELRTPLNAIGGYTQLLDLGIRGPLNGAQRADVRRIGQNQRHLLSLINDILNFAKVEAGRVEVELCPVTLAELVVELEGLVAPQLEAKGLRYEVTLRCPELRVRADPEKVRQILLNLLSNAIKFTAPGGEVALLCEPTPTGAHVSVRDNGCGIPADKLDAVFEPFVQLGRSLTSGHEGTGLGLAISRDLARAMGGDLVARSDPGRGSTFTLMLPGADEGS